MFLAQLWGPALLAVGVGVFTSHTYYVKIYRDLEKDALAVLVLGMLAMAVGTAQVLAHNIWSTFPQIVISILGWGTLLKGAAFLVAPGAVDRAGDMWANLKLIPLAGVSMLLIGGYLSWFAYLA